MTMTRICFFWLFVVWLGGGTDGFTPNSLFFRSTAASTALVQISSSVALPTVPKNNVSQTLKNAGRKYVQLSEEKPIITKGVSAAVVGGLGDVLSQALLPVSTGTRFSLDLQRTVVFATMGLCFKGPVLHFWYGMLAKIANWTQVHRGFGEARSTLTAVGLDQTIGVAMIYPLNYLVFELVSAALSWRVPSLLTVQAKMTATLIPVILAQYYVWPVAQLLSFKLVPPSLRVLYTDGISVFWNCFMCAQMAR